MLVTIDYQAHYQTLITVESTRWYTLESVINASLTGLTINCADEYLDN